MSLKGKIIDIIDEGKKARVLVKPVSNCNGCKACAGIIKSSKVVNEEFEIEVLTNNFEIKKGDHVKVELNEYQGSKVAILIYGLPIIGFLIGMFSSPYICSLFHIGINDLIRVICSFIGLFLTFICLFIYFKHNKSNSFIMFITDKY